MSDHTEKLTADELAFKRDILAKYEGRDALQTATLRASIATGLRYGTCVGGGKFHVNVVGYRLTKKGKPTGYGKVRMVRENVTRDEAVAIMQKLERDAA